MLAFVTNRMSCTSCDKKGGCGTRKAGEKELIGAALASLFPSRRWDAIDEEAAFLAGVSEETGRHLARQMESTLRAPARFVRGDDLERCDWIYVLCVGREPGIVELREQDSLYVADAVDGVAIEERYLRVALSRVAPVAAVQEVVLELQREGDVYMIEERPRNGIYDPILLGRTQKLVELLVEHDVAYLDFGLVVRPPAAFAPETLWSDDGYAERYGEQPGVVNYLFYPQPATARSLVVVPARAA